MDLKKAYYYIICLGALLVLAWGLVDLTSTIVGLSTARLPSGQISSITPEKESEPYLELYYQKKMLYDRLTDSIARVVISGLIFAYSRAQVNRLES